VAPRSTHIRRRLPKHALSDTIIELVGARRAEADQAGLDMGRLQCWLKVFLSYRLGEQHTAGGAVAAMNLARSDPGGTGLAALGRRARSRPVRRAGTCAARKVIAARQARITVLIDEAAEDVGASQSAGVNVRR
jgi:hypothetical protein